ncbi:hypothetical protein CHUV0807_0991 [Cardiobacterium hominis]|uniref:Uncharacterized protein n=1 Tax=Cardiobacterium hominis TaxID=2718 RepID=A0A1C3H3P0_9GAMM|nr:DUF5713 family protein [Cardiobacterium hominis]SAM62237.1 hypothetical protein CHUV0807_0991 [Cardiobacterium hominis]
MSAFDADYQPLYEMYDDEYFPNFLVDKIKAELDKVEAVLAGGEKDTAIIQQYFDTMTRAINDLEAEFDANDSEIETVARESIAEAVDYLLQKYRIAIDLEEALREREW